MDEVRIGIAGLGHRGVNWISQLQRYKGFRITAIYDWIEPLHERALEAISYRDDVKIFSNYADFLAFEGMDAVGLCVRQENQGAMAAQALLAGKHVNAEVPAAHTIEDCWNIVIAVEQTGQVYQLAEQTRYWGFVESWKELVENGDLGRVTYCEGQYIGFYGSTWYFRDYQTGKFYSCEEIAHHPEAEPTWAHLMPPIHYLPHELSPMLKVLGTRVIEVIGMSTGSPSYSMPEVKGPDIQVALMKTETDILLRMAVGFTQPVPNHNHHWYQIIGTRGRLEWKRANWEKPKMWLAGHQMDDYAEMDWQFARRDAPSEAKGSGHGDADYYVHASFRDALLSNSPLSFDVYQAMDTAAPAILAAESMAHGSQLKRVPDFRPGKERKKGQMPSESKEHAERSTTSI